MTVVGRPRTARRPCPARSARSGRSAARAASELARRRAPCRARRARCPARPAAPRRHRSRSRPRRRGRAASPPGGGRRGAARRRSPPPPGRRGRRSSTTSGRRRVPRPRPSRPLGPRPTTATSQCTCSSRTGVPSPGLRHRRDAARALTLDDRPARAGVWQLRTYETPSTTQRQFGQSPARQSVPPRPGWMPPRSSASATESPGTKASGTPSTVSSGGSATPDVTQRVPLGKRVGRVEHVLREAGDPRLAGDRRHHRRFSPTVVSSIRRPVKTVPRMPSCRNVSPTCSSPLACRQAIAAHVPVPHGERSIAPVQVARPVPVELAVDTTTTFRRDTPRVRRRRVQLADRDVVDAGVLRVHDRQLLARPRP